MSTFLNPQRVYSRQQVLTRPSPIPAAGGVYGWWFRQLPPLVDAHDCRRLGELSLLYAGISPRQPPRAPATPDGEPVQRVALAAAARDPLRRERGGFDAAQDAGLPARR